MSCNKTRPCKYICRSDGANFTDTLAIPFVQLRLRLRLVLVTAWLQTFMTRYLGLFFFTSKLSTAADQLGQY